MSSRIRLLWALAPDGQGVCFQLAFAAPEEGAPTLCAPARLETGDGRIIDLGVICAPTAFTWHHQRAQDLATHRYTTAGPFTARLLWGEEVAQAEVGGMAGGPLTAAAVTRPELTLFAIEPVAGSLLERTVKLEATGLTPQHRLRLDGGAGLVHLLSGADGATQRGEWILGYPKPGRYTVAVDLLDADGFWLATLAESPLEVAAPDEATVAALPAEPAVAALPAEPSRAAEPLAAVADAPTAAATAQPWLPFRYARPMWAWARTYTVPGGSSVSRALAAGTYLGIRDEVLVGGELWYQTGGRDWIPASSVALMTPSELRGEVLDGAAPPPPPPPPPPAVRRGVVTASVLNVRARPGVYADNPPIAQLRAGDEVSIYEEQVVAGAAWYRIGTGRWVHSGWVRLLDVQSAARTLTSAAGAPLSLPIGWVATSVLNVRGRPGVAADNPPIDQVRHNQSLPILETRSVGGSNWYRIGEDRWVEGTWVGVARFRSRPATIGSGERWVGVNLKEQTAVAYEGDRPVYAALVATGLPGTPTVQGIFRTWRRLPSGKMAGGSPGRGYYYLEEVTWTCYFYSGYALHTAYWHDAFGRPRSHGCVNLSPYDAWWIFQWSAAGGANSPAVYVYGA